MENIEIYFESIKQVYNQILDWEKERTNRPEPFKQKVTNFLTVSSLVIFLLSLIPIIPSLFVFIGSRFSWTVLGFHLSQATIWTYALTWLIGIVATLLFLLLNIWVDSKINPTSKQEKAPHSLSSEQSTFIFVYQAYKELKVFFVSHIDQNIEKALTSLKDLEIAKVDRRTEDDFDLMHLPPEVRYREMERYTLGESFRLRSTKNRSSLTRQIFVAQEFLQTFEKYSWFHIDDLTKARLQALISFQKKILVRLKKREDLPAVLNVLENLSKFLFAFLPEHQTNMNSDELKALQAEGIECLDKFVDDVNKLIDYPTEEHSNKLERPNKSLTFIQKMQLLYFGNIFIRFIVWLLFLLAITTGLIYVVSLKITNLDINVMVSTVIATSVTGATALAVIGNKPQKVMRELKNKSMQHLHNAVDEQDEV